ncbi:MAG: tetratricopeptide repeat protein [Verrucomicrobiales bacterium]|nr:tetratricopeptide repeat protein [Verrucomicrobiae bacterium]
MPDSDPSPDTGTSQEVQEVFDDANGDLAVGDLSAAIEKYRQCVALDPAFFDGWHALGMALMKTGQLKEAIGAGLMATSLKPNDLLAWTGLSQMYVKNGQIAEAEDAKGNARILSLGGRVVKDS